MKDKKKIIIGSIILVVIAIISLGGYYFLNREDEQTTLTLLEKQWIESNKNKVFDFGVLSDIPVFSVEGDGAVFDFFAAIEKDTKLSFNKTSYGLVSALNTEYAFRIVKEKAKEDLLLYQDHYVLLTKEPIKFHKQTDIKDQVIGVLDDDLSNANKYLKDGVNLSFKTYGDANLLLLSLESDTTAILVPRVKNLKEIMTNDELNIAYNVVEMKEDYVFTLGSDKRLNTIITKYFKKWHNENFEESFNKHFTNSYFSFNGVDNKERVKFRSKRYAYGFLDNLPYDSLMTERLQGINSNILQGFATLADIEISYEKYSEISTLVKEFNENKLDFIYEMNSNVDYATDVINTIPVYESRSVILIPLDRSFVINSLRSLEKENVAVIKGSKIAAYLNKNEVKVKEYDNLKDLFKNRDDKLIAMDYYSYQYYVQTELKDYSIGFEFTLDTDKSFALRDISANELFNDYFNFYLTYLDERAVLNYSYSQLFKEGQSSSLLLTIGNIFGYVALVLVTVYEGVRYINKKKKKEPVLTKSDKLKYIDMLTSLKNRNYLNDNIDRWDSSDIYPQAIVIVDLNNVAYINDNYGYQEGDKVIREAANILINSQIENSDIIRTSGNEFLVYLIGHEEKQVVSYIRRLNKEFKELSHGFGAAIGYSLIVDGIKTIDDAVNEATLDMRVNKEAAAEENGKN
jgi:diguanylate cyclase (GGDEF)-like protein